MENKNVGIGLFGILGIVFIVLKLVGVISWSWLWVLAPFWMPIGLAVVLFGISALLRLIAGRWW